MGHNLERKRLKSLEKAEEIIREEESKLKEEIAKLRKQITNLQEELKVINEERDIWIQKLENGTFTTEELTGILDYTNQLSLKAQEILNNIAAIKEKEENLKKILSDKMRIKISIDSVKARLKDKITSEETLREIRKLDDYTKLKRWFAATIIFIPFPYLSSIFL